MAQFDVYKNPNPHTNHQIPYLLDMQNNLLKNLKTRAVVPLVANMKPAKYLNLTFEIQGETVTLSMAELAAIPLSALGEYVCSLGEHRDEIIAALDFLITGI